MLQHGLAVNASERGAGKWEPVRGRGNIDSALDEDVQIVKPRMDAGRTASDGEDRSGDGEECGKCAMRRFRA